VAEHVFLLILALYKRLLAADASLRQGKWLQWELRPASHEIAGKTFGILGLGRIGQEVAIRARAFDARLVYYDVQRPSQEAERAMGALPPLDELSPRSISCRSTSLPAPNHTPSRAKLAKMKPSRPD
jgi:phosphoglycerate dehydrogenase-like enzyme